jgi:hypothetical protein
MKESRGSKYRVAALVPITPSVPAAVWHAANGLGSSITALSDSDEPWFGHEGFMIGIMNPLSWCFVRPYRAIRTAAWTNPTNLLDHHEPLMTGFMNPLSRRFVHPQIHQGSDLVFCPTAKIS